MVKAANAEHLTGEWETPICETCTQQPGTWCFSFWCPCVVAYTQRKQLLAITNEPYVCCGGLFPYGPCGRPRDHSPWLCLETVCCPLPAVLGNRFLIQTRLDRKNTGCDNFMIGAGVGGACLSASGRMTGDLDSQNTGNWVTACVTACLLTQQQVEVDRVLADPNYVYTGVPEKIRPLVAVPAQVSMSTTPEASAKLELP